MANNGTIQPNTGGIGRKSRTVLLFVLAMLLVVPGISDAAPEIDAASKPFTKDSNNDGHIDQVVVTLTEALTGQVPIQGQGSFGVAGYEVIDVTEDHANKKYTLVLTPKAAYDTGATPLVSYQGDSEVAIDKASPILVAAEGDDKGGPSMFTTIGETLRAYFSERVSLYTVDSTGAPIAPATTGSEMLLALERGLQVGPVNRPGCGSDGDGTQAVNPSGSPPTTPKRNFPSLSASVATQPDPTAPPVVIDAQIGLITINMPNGYDGSGTGYKFNVTPESLPASQHCTLGIFVDFRASVQDLATPTKNPATVRLGGAALINHVKGELVGDPETVDFNGNGKIDGVTLSFNHPAKHDSIINVLDLTSRLSISTGTGPTTVAATNLSCATCEAAPAGSSDSVTISFDEISAWNTSVKPNVSYDGSGACSSSQIVVLLVNGLTECANTFAKASIDKARPVILQAKTRDIGTDPAAPVSNGKNDAVELVFSEAIEDDTIDNTTGATPAWTITGYTVNDFHTGAAADDATALLQFNEVGIDTANTSTLQYTQLNATGQEDKVADKNGNLLANIAAPGVAVADGAGPALVAGSVNDAVGAADGRIDTAKLTFSEALLADGPVNLAKIKFSEAAEEAAATAASVDAADNKVVNATINGGVPGTSAKDLSVLAGAVFDAVGNQAPAVRLESSSVTDLAKPVAVGVTPRGQNGASVPVTITFSESMDVNSAPTVTYGLGGNFDDVTIAPVADDDHTNGYLESDTTKWHGTAAEPEGGNEACTIPEGCDNTLKIAGAKAVAGEAKDNAYEPDTRHPWTIDTVAPAAPPAFTSPANGASFPTAGTSRDVTVAGTSTESNLTIQVYEGDTLRGTALSNATGNWSATLPTLGLGAHALKLRAVDAGGNQSTFSGLRTIYVKQTTSLTLGHNMPAIVFGKSATISGLLRNSGGTGLSNRTVTIQVAPYGTTSWRNLVTLRTNSSGAYAFNYRAGQTWVYRALYNGEATFMNAVSASRTLLVRVYLTAGQTASTIRYGQTMTFYGSIRPSKAGKKIYLQVRNANGTYSNIGAVLLDRYSNYRIVFKPTVRGTRTYRIFYPRQDNVHWEYWSGPRTLKVT